MPRAWKSSLTRTRLLGWALLAAPALTALAMLTDGGADVVGALIFIALWTVFVGLWVGIAWLDLLRPESRGYAAFAVGIVAIVLAVALTIVGGLVVLPALCLIPLAASRGFRVRTAISMVLLAAASLLYVAVLIA
jgi:hypothetical protein